MTDSPDGNAAPDAGSKGATPPDEAVIRKRRLSWVWLIPAASLLIGGWLLWTSFAHRGPLIEITFSTAGGLQAGQSAIKFRDIQVGTVESFDLTPDHSGVIMHARMTNLADGLLTDGAEFWVVKPRIFAGDITGLTTVLSGSYVEMQPGVPGRPARTSFKGLANPPTLSPGTPGRQFRLTAPRLGSISIGSPVYYRNLEVGKVLGWDVAGMADSVTLAVFIDAPYDTWVHDDTRFWNSSGISVELGSQGVELHVDSLKAALLGAITFDTPTEAGAAASAAGATFVLYPRHDQADTASSKSRVLLASYFTGSVGGLAVGARVTLQGSAIGNVTAVDLQFNNDTGTSRVRAEMAIRLELLKAVGGHPPRPLPELLQAMVKSGLRTRLSGGNLLTGQKELAFVVDADAPAAELAKEGDVWIIPIDPGGSGGLDELSAAAHKLLTKVTAMPFAEIGQNLNAALAGVSGIANGPQLKQALSRLDAALAATQDMVRHLDAGAAPTLKRLPAIAAELQDTLAQVRKLVGSVSAGSAGDGRFGRDLDRALVQISEAAQAVRQVADLLDRHPEALIRGRTGRAGE